MSFLEAFQKRASQAVSAARDLASNVSADVYQNAKVLAESVAADAQHSEARSRSQACVPMCPVSDGLLAHVRSLTYASFNEEDALSAVSSDKPLEPWQVAHATEILRECKELESLRFVLCPKRMSESLFWARYFKLIDGFISHESTYEGREVDADVMPAATSNQPTPSRSGISGWEDVAADDAQHVPRDDLDKYLQDMLDGNHVEGSASDGGDDLGHYLEELEAGGPGPREWGREQDVDEDDLAQYLGDLDVEDEAMGTEGGASPEAVKTG